MEGPLRRKTLLKEGKKPTVSDSNSNFSCDSDSGAAILNPRIRLNLQLGTTLHNVPCYSQL